MPSLRSVLALCAAVAPALALQYDMIKDYSGPSFFDDWTFFNNFDNLTNGDVTYVARDNQNLAYVDKTTNRAIMKVDNTSTVPFNEKRKSVRITSNTAYKINTLFVADFYHVPYGCSVWPAYWSQAPNWPTGGEIDTFEAVNMSPSSQSALHTLQGCTQVNAMQSSTLVNSTNCDYTQNGNEGCVVTNPSPASTGEAFASAGGGIFVTEFSDKGISVWFFNRNSIPDVLKSNASSVDSTNFGTPVSNWPTGGCSIDKFFAAQHLIFDISLCGDFAGAPTIFSQTCTGTCYKDYVVGDGSRYSTAYFDVASVKVYSKTGSNTAETSGAASIPGLHWGSALASVFAVVVGFFM